MVFQAAFHLSRAPGRILSLPTLAMLLSCPIRDLVQVSSKERWTHFTMGGVDHIKLPESYTPRFGK